ncbi:MAG TPA: hypothetical protein VMF06_21560 [Candidatus Limnocylindria bacterium]|jgi:hypothetical protein|nr:hypothetical protein [Candidatus Limnocylindria bacterium]
MTLGRLAFLAWFSSYLLLSARAETNVSVRLFVEDGQLRTHPFRVFINRPIAAAMNPKIRLLTSHSFLRPKEGENDGIPPRIVADNQQETHEIDGVKISLSGTILVFDLSSYPLHAFKPTVRVEPILEWDDKAAGGAATQFAAGQTVYLGNLPVAAVYAVAVIGVLVVMLAVISRIGKASAIYLLCGTDGALSLWRAQAALWTVAVGTMLLLYGLLRKEVPSIPDTLVMLMGMTVITGGLSQWQEKKKDGALPVDGRADDPATMAIPVAPNSQPASSDPSAGAKVTVAQTQPKLSDLVSDINPAGVRELSITQAQLVFWTCLTIGLFVVKTSTEGKLWDVPGQLVALMGISQASYLGSKLATK